MNTLLFLLVCASMIAYNVFLLLEIRRPREIRLLWGRALTAWGVTLTSVFYYDDPSKTPVLAYAFIIVVWGSLAVVSTVQLWRQTTMVPSLYGLVLSDRDYQKALSVATTERFKGTLKPAPVQWEGEDDLTGR